MTIWLPFEILTAIFEKVDDVQDLRSIRATSRTFYAAVVPLAFRILSVTSTVRSAQNLGNLFDVPEIAAYVKEVTYHEISVDKRNLTPESLTLVRAGAAEELAGSFSRVHQLTQLETIDLTFFPATVDSHSRGHLARQASILGALALSFSTHAPSKLTSLSLHNLRITDLAPLTFTPFQTVLKNLRRLRLSVLYDISDDELYAFDHWMHFWGTLCRSVIISPAQHTLTELTIHTELAVGALSGFSLTGLYFPNLHALSLRTIVFELSVGVEPFTLRHATTLTRLELLTCKLLLDDPTDVRHTRWEHIWDSFATGLSALVALHIDESGDGSEHRYARPGPVLGYFIALAPAQVDVADAAALERLYVTVAARSEEVRGVS